MKHLRLLITEDCDRACAGCCNKDWDLQALPVATDFSGYELIMLTGGEPVLYPEKLKAVTEEIRRQNENAKIVLYTANTTSFLWQEILDMVDGITLTIHENSDVENFEEFLLDWHFEKGLSLRLNVFKGIDLNAGSDLSAWKIKDNIEWIEDCPLPTNEVLMRYETP